MGPGVKGVERLPLFVRLESPDNTLSLGVRLRTHGHEFCYAVLLIKVSLVKYLSYRLRVSPVQ